jgi:hypothetical protein
MILFPITFPEKGYKTLNTNPSYNDVVSMDHEMMLLKILTFEDKPGVERKDRKYCINKDFENRLKQLYMTK